MISGHIPGSSPDRQIKVLFVDDDPINTTSFVVSFSDQYDILTAASGEEGLEIFQREKDIAIVLSDQKMDGMSGVDFLCRVYEKSPEAVRIIVTGYVDVSDIIDAINKGHIYQYVLKPWDIVQLGLILDQAVQTWVLTKENMLLAEKLRRNNELLQATNEQLRNSEERLRFLSSALIKAQENERKRISMELHDELGQSLAAVKLQIKVLQNKLHGSSEMSEREINGNLEQLRSVLDEIIENVRRLSKNLSPVIIDDLGMDAAIENLVLNFSKIYGIRCSFHPCPLGHLFGHDAQRLIYRLIQEALNNVGRHSNARTVDILFLLDGEQLVIRLQDDGDGFDLEEIEQQDASERGIGLTAMTERTNMLGGTVQIKSEQGQGTLVVFDIPIPAENSQSQKKSSG
ncbi:response regulator [Desulfolithobacter sp.]